MRLAPQIQEDRNALTGRDQSIIFEARHFFPVVYCVVSPFSSLRFVYYFLHASYFYRFVYNFTYIFWAPKI